MSRPSSLAISVISLAMADFLVPAGPKSHSIRSSPDIAFESDLLTHCMMSCTTATRVRR